MLQKLETNVMGSEESCDDGFRNAPSSQKHVNDHNAQAEGLITSQGGLVRALTFLFSNKKKEVNNSTKCICQ